MPRCVCTTSKDDVTKRCKNEALYPTYNPQYCGKHVNSDSKQVFVRSPSPHRQNLQF